jgi:hypothetical protein
MYILKTYKSWLTSVSILAVALTLSASPVPQLAASVSKQLLAVVVQGNTDSALAAVRRQDRVARNANGVMTRLSPDEHLRRAAI